MSTSSKPAGRSTGQVLGILAGLVVVLGAVQYGSSSDAADADTPAAAQIERAAAPEASCTTDWRLCKDNADLMQLSPSRLGAEPSATSPPTTSRATETANGAGYRFQTLFAGDDYVKTGVVKMVDDKVSFPTPRRPWSTPGPCATRPEHIQCSATVSIEDFLWRGTTNLQGPAPRAGFLSSSATAGRGVLLLFRRGGCC